RSARRPEDIMDRRFAHITIDKQNRGSKLGQRNRRVRRRGGVAFLRTDTRYKDRFGRIPGGRQQQGCSQRAIRFGGRRAAVELHQARSLHFCRGFLSRTERQKLRWVVLASASIQ